MINFPNINCQSNTNIVYKQNVHDSSISVPTGTNHKKQLVEM